MIEVRFGYLQEPTVIDWIAGTISPLGNIDNIVEQVQADERSGAEPIGEVVRSTAG